MASRTALICMVGLVVSVAAVSAEARGQCQAPTAWFPHSQTPEPDFHAPGSNCEFHQWAWQTFLWLTQPTADGRIRLLDLPTAEALFMPGKAPATLDATVRTRLTKQKLLLTPRVTKKAGTSTFGDILQAGSRGVLVDQAGRPVYYASHVSPTFYQFVRTNRLFLRDNYLAAAPTLNFPVKSLELKSSWRVVPNGEPAPGFFTTKALVHPIACADGAANCMGAGVIVDRTKTEEVTVALVGLHVVGVVEDHPEFIWSTFEHVKNAPDLPPGVPPTSPNPVSGSAHTFYAANTPAKDCNAHNATTLTFDSATKKLGPITQVFREFALGGGDAGDKADITSLNASVHKQLTADSVWKNYALVGGVWFGAVNGLTPGLSGMAIQNLTVASVQLSNATMETFTQHAVPPAKTNCFSCHNTAPKPAPLALPAKNLNLSHILMNGLLTREELTRTSAKALRVTTAPPLKNYAEVQKLLNEFVSTNNIPIQFSPHADFWNTMTHAQFTTGTIPGVAGMLKVLIPKNSKESNLIMSLRGTKGTIFDPETGSIGRMPPSGPFMSEEDISRIAHWIDQGCPDTP